jgi:hypothetical protein
MKKAQQIIFISALLAAVVFSSCKKTTEAGPAGKDGNRFPYKQTGTILNLEGNFYSDDASFDNQVNLPFFSTLDENKVNSYYPALRTSGTVRTSGNGKNDDFYIVRYDSIGNSMMSFDITYDYNDVVSINDFHFNVKTNVTETSYRKVYTTYGGGGARVSGPYDYESGLSEYNLTTDGNSFSISNWNYNSTTKVLSFDYSGTLTGAYNSTGNDLSVSGTVKANLKDESLRVTQ